jgi:hypothetical protein
MRLCGARKRSGGRCRHPVMPGRNSCWTHGPRTGNHTHPAWIATQHAPWGPTQWRGRSRRQAVMRALGLPWYGGRRKQKAVLNMAEKAVALANDILELLPAPRDVPDDQKGAAELLGEGVRSGLLLSRDTIQLGQSLLLDADGNKLTTLANMHPQDLKFLSLASIAALGTVKLGLKAADTGRRNDIIGKLIAAIAAEQEGK